MKTTKSKCLCVSVRVLAVMAFVAICYIVRTRRSWKTRSDALVSQLVGETYHVDHDTSIMPIAGATSCVLDEIETFHELPEIVQRYFTAALLPGLETEYARGGGIGGYDDNDDDETLLFIKRKASSRSIPMIRSLCFQQSGLFKMGQDEKSWVRFTAQQHVAAQNPVLGFVWDATVLMAIPTTRWLFPLEIPVTVRDVYVGGKGILEVQVGHLARLLNLHDDPNLDLGELLRWLAEAVLVPTALLPSRQIKWEQDPNGDELRAKVTVNDTLHNNHVAELIMEFSPNGLPSKVYAMRPKLAQDGRSELKPWEGSFTNYQVVSGMLVPTQAEVGWRNEVTGELETYFRGEMFDFDFTFS